MVDFGILVALPIEEAAVKRCIKNANSGQLPDSGTHYIQGEIKGYSVVLVKSPYVGSVSSALATKELLQNFKPRNVVLLGIAAGFRENDIKLGEVILGDPVIAYEYSKVYDTFEEHDTRPFLSPQNAVKNSGIENAHINVNQKATVVKVGPIATGSKIVASGRFRKKLLALNRKMLALEMEAEGVAAAARMDHNRVDFFILKAVSDYADQKTKGKRKGAEKNRHELRQSMAAAASAKAFVHFVALCKEKKLFPLPKREQPKAATLPKSLSPPAAAESALLGMARGKPLSIDAFDMQCRLFPVEFWGERRTECVYVDDPESANRIVIDWADARLPEKTLNNLVAEIDEALRNIKAGQKNETGVHPAILKKIRDRLNEGCNAYPRPVAPPQVLRTGVSTMLRVTVGPSRFGIALVEEWGLRLPTATGLRSNRVLNSLAVRCALVFPEADGRWWLEFHQRKGGPNATYANAWDVGAAGYIDPGRHKDPEARNRVSPWQACAAELSEELGIDKHQLPHRDHYFFFGMGRNEPTGQLDLLGVCELGWPLKQRPLTHRVRAFDRCPLDPESAASFVIERKRWVPTAVLTLVLLLEFYGYPRARVHAAFSRLAGKLNLKR